MRRLPPLLAIAVAVTAPAQVPAEAAASRTAPPPPRLLRSAVLPEAITSFGACCSGGWAYVFGGHVGREHAHSRANVVGAFHRLNLADGVSWQSLPTGPALQGTALVAGPDGSLYRVGGLTARNEPGADADLHSTATVARFDPRRLLWEDCTPLPEPRSSHDAIVLGDRLYVAGGWHLHGDDHGTWLRTTWVADLRQQPLAWQPLPALDHDRRAGALATCAGRVVLLGGMGADGPLASGVMLDPAQPGWHAVPPLPGQGFGTAAIGVGEQLYATVADGRLLRWDGAAPAWQPVCQLELPRFFHRLLPTPDGALLALGGAARGGHTRATERIELPTRPGPVFHERVIPAPGQVSHRQALLLRDHTLWAFGGNRGGRGDRFQAGQLANDIWRIDLLQATATLAGELPTPSQSMATVALAGTAAGALLGGLGVVDGDDGPGTVRSLATGYRWDPRRASLQPFADLPEPRTQTALVQLGDRLWVLGGTDFTPDDDGGTTRGDMRAIWTCDLAAEAPAFVRSELSLPRPRRSFGAAVLAGELVVLGGLGEGFDHAGPGDVLDPATGAWRELPTPAAWVSPQVAVIGDRLYVACGGTMAGRRFTPDPALWSYRKAEGWRRELEQLPFPVRHVQLLTLRNRLLFYGVEAATGSIVIRTYEPDPDVVVPESAMHR